MNTYADFIKQFEKYYTKQKFDERYDVYRALQYIMSMNSKRIRPVLTLMSCDLFGGEVKSALPAAMAVELYHNATLVHDDIMDNATQRRGKPTVHKAYGNNVSINTGDVMFMVAYRYLLQLKNKDNIHELLRIYIDAVIAVIEGQSLDMEFERVNEISEANYLKMIHGKTSVLLAAASQMGAWLAGADKPTQQIMYRFGLNLGLAFQIQDDYLDAFGKSQKTGKVVGGDIVLNKKTLLLVKALEFADSTQKKKIRLLLSEKNKQKKVNELQKLMELTGSKEYTEKTIDKYYRKAVNELARVALPQEQKRPLGELVEILRFREK